MEEKLRDSAKNPDGTGRWTVSQKSSGDQRDPEDTFSGFRLAFGAKLVRRVTRPLQITRLDRLIGCQAA